MAVEVQTRRGQLAVHPLHFDFACLRAVGEAVVGLADDVDGVGEDEVARVVPDGVRRVEIDGATIVVGGDVLVVVEDHVAVAARLDGAVAGEPRDALEAE